MKNRTLRIGLSIVISAGFLVFAVRKVDWTEAGAALAAAQYLYIIPMLVVSIWSLYIRAQRWRVLLRPLGNPAMSTLVAATNIGFMANMVLPLRMGEVIRPLLVCRKEHEPLGGVLATILLERIFDLFTILFLFGVVAATVSVSDAVRFWGYSMFAGAMTIGVAVAFVRWQEVLALRILGWFLRPLPPRFSEAIEQFFRGFVRALQILDSPVTVMQVLGWSLYLWLVISSTYGFGVLAFGLPVPLAVGAMAIMAVIAMAVAAPSAPGFIGAFQAGCIVGLAIFNVSESQAIAYSIVLHLTQFVGTVAAGLYSLTREGMSFRQLEEVSESDVAPA